MTLISDGMTLPRHAEIHSWVLSVLCSFMSLEKREAEASSPNTPMMTNADLKCAVCSWHRFLVLGWTEWREEKNISRWVSLMLLFHTDFCFIKQNNFDGEEEVWLWPSLALLLRGVKFLTDFHPLENGIIVLSSIYLHTLWQLSSFVSLLSGCWLGFL